MLSFIIGCFVGACWGVLVAGLLAVAGEDRNETQNK